MNSRVKVGPIVESGNRTQSFLDALMTVEIVVSVKSPSVEARGQDDTVEGGGVVRCIETDKNSIDKTVAGGGGANTRFEIGSVGEARRQRDRRGRRTSKRKYGGTRRKCVGR